MRKIDRSGQDSQDKKDAGKHDAALDKLREIKAALSNAKSPEEIKLLMARFVHIADVIPQELMPSDLSMSSMESVYVNQLAQISDPRQQISEQDLRSGEKSSERAMSGIAFLNKELKSFLEREDVKAHRKKTAAWAKSDMNVQEIQDFKKSREKIKDERSMLIRAVAATPIEELHNKGKAEERRLAAVHGSENHAEVVKCRKANELQMRTLSKQAQAVKESIQNELDVFKKKNVSKELGEGYVRNAQKDLQDEFAQLNKLSSAFMGIDKHLDDKALANKLTERLVVTKGGDPVLSPGLTPNNPKTQSRGITSTN